jgi:hypothetical protein
MKSDHHRLKNEVGTPVFDNVFTNISGIEVGIDIATSFTIIVSLIALVLESRRQAKKEREKGIDQNARNVAAGQIANTIARLSDTFINRVVKNSQSYENRVDVYFENGGEEKLLRLISRSESFFEDRKSDLNGLRESISDFFENLHELKYQIVPVLDTLTDGAKFIAALKEEISDIAAQHSKLGSGYLALISEYEDFSKALAESEEGINDDIFKRAMSIIGDLDYWQWVKSFVDSDDRARCKALLEAGDYSDEAIHSMIASLLANTRERPVELMIQIYALASGQVQEARKECKDVLCNISAIYHLLISKDSQFNLADIIARYKGDGYFAIDKEIR